MMFEKTKKLWVDNQTGTAAQSMMVALLLTLVGVLWPGGAATPNQPATSTDKKEVRGLMTPKHDLHTYPTHTVTATIYWAGEGADSDNAGISNVPTAWDPDAAKSFGGVDDPSLPRKADGTPASFTPKHNPYYCALPANEYDDHGNIIPEAHKLSPWANEAASLKSYQSLFKGRWVKVNNIYCQWHDTGPSDNVNVRDYGYVFGTAKPQNKFNHAAGIDLSPTAAKAVGFTVDGEGYTTVTWQFVDADKVPDGPWKKYPPIDNIDYWAR